ncbi:MAG: hypothetical protein LBQ32_11730 [Burkholderiaceae bacterium]|jgi:tetratricopeptide (TPR) repeat protein|nr:hypothetical protein [Burkholderiaceae bacterium]
MRLNWKPSVFLFGVLGLAVLVYWPGLRGGFLFDDFHNLKDLGAYGGVVDLETLKTFVFGGVSGPSGRPLSLLSFLLDDNTWPSRAAWFKPTNLLLHLLCGLLLCWATLLLLRQFRFDERQAQWMAVFSSACWLLHPLMVSTTLYVVQRMAQLSTLFVFAGMVAYLHGRSLLAVNKRVAYLWMTLAVGIGTVLAVYSKENGVLLPLLLLVIEFCIPDSTRRPARTWRLLFLGLPSLALLAYLATFINFSENPWLGRSFNQIERLWSEARILMEYLRLLLVPQIEGRGLIQDGYDISRGWLQPWTTLPSVMGVVALFVLALSLRKRAPLVSLAMLFFFVGHLLESSLLGLELYFEHRNYLSAAFFFLPLAWGLVRLSEKITPSLVVVIGVCCLSVLAFLTWQRAQLWQDSDRLELYWASENLDSPRAQNIIARYLLMTGRADEGFAQLEAAIERMPNSAYLNVALLLHKVHAHKAVARDFELTGERLRTQTFDVQAVTAIRQTVDRVVASKAPDFYPEAMLGVVDAMANNPNYSQFHDTRRFMPYLKGRLYLAKLDLAQACEQFRKTMPLYADVGGGLMMAAEMASYRGHTCALMLLDEAEQILQNKPDRALKRSRSAYERDIKGLREAIERDVAEWARKHPEQGFQPVTSDR